MTTCHVILHSQRWCHASTYMEFSSSDRKLITMLFAFPDATNKLCHRIVLERYHKIVNNVYLLFLTLPITKAKLDTRKVIDFSHFITKN